MQPSTWGRRKGTCGGAWARLESAVNLTPQIPADDGKYGDASDDEVKPPTDEEAWAAVVASLEVEVREAASQRAEDEAEARKAPKSKKGKRRLL